MSNPTSGQPSVPGGGVDHRSRFFVKQRLTMMVNRYEIRAANPDGSVGELLAVAQQKRMAFREQVTFFTDESRTVPVFSFKARQAMDLAAVYDVFDAAGTPIGYFRKDFTASLLRSSFHLGGPGIDAYGQERNVVIAVLRRFTEFAFPVHFDFTDKQTGAVVMSSARQMTIGDRYTIDVPDPRVDFRLAAAMAVGLDTLLQR
ncbi:hypothetical protein ACFFGH_30245 [Lysobacter korlensis]|uniref:Scramblase n=1 Tax=Lysobacter korlensis TaxID=553636 RepID=A0ABV6RYR9_9GAMM